MSVALTYMAGVVPRISDIPTEALLANADRSFAGIILTWHCEG